MYRIKLDERKNIFSTIESEKTKLNRDRKRRLALGNYKFYFEFLNKEVIIIIKNP